MKYRTIYAMPYGAGAMIKDYTAEQLAAQLEQMTADYGVPTKRSSGYIDVLKTATASFTYSEDCLSEQRITIYGLTFDQVPGGFRERA